MSWLKLCSALCGDNDKVEGEDKEESVIIHAAPAKSVPVFLSAPKKIVVDAKASVAPYPI